MLKRKTFIGQVHVEEKSTCEAINKLAAASNRASSYQLRWAKSEENTDILHTFCRLAELNWIWSELLRRLADGYKGYSKVFKDIYQEEKIVEDAIKALQSCSAKVTKLQKQLESARKKNDTAKTTNLEVELTTQNSLYEHLSASVDNQVQKLELYKLDLIKKGLLAQTESLQSFLNKCQTLSQAQQQLATSFPSALSLGEEKEETTGCMAALVARAADSLGIHPPPNGGVDIKKLTVVPTLSPRQSVQEFDLTGSSRTPSSSFSSPVHHSSEGGLPSPDSDFTAESSPCPLRFHPFPGSPSPTSPTSLGLLRSKEKEKDVYRASSCGVSSFVTDRPLHISARPFNTHKVPVRRTQSGSPLIENQAVHPRDKHLSASSLDGLQEATATGDLKDTKPILHNESDDSQNGDRTENGDGTGTLRAQSRTCTYPGQSGSGVFSSSNEDMGMNDLESGSTKTTLSEGSQNESDDSGYANPIDAVQELLHYRENMLASTAEEGTANSSGPDGRSSPLPPARAVREVMVQVSDVARKTSTSSDHESAANTDDPPAYTSPFDALKTLEAYRVTKHRAGSPSVARSLVVSADIRQMAYHHRLREAQPSPEDDPSCTRSAGLRGSPSGASLAGDTSERNGEHSTVTHVDGVFPPSRMRLLQKLRPPPPYARWMSDEPRLHVRLPIPGPRDHVACPPRHLAQRRSTDPNAVDHTMRASQSVGSLSPAISRVRATTPPPLPPRHVSPAPPPPPVPPRLGSPLVSSEDSDLDGQLVRANSPAPIQSSSPRTAETQSRSPEVPGLASPRRSVSPGWGSPRRSVSPGLTSRESEPILTSRRPKIPIGRTVSANDINPEPFKKRWKPVPVRKMRSGQARVINVNDYRKPLV